MKNDKVILAAMCLTMFLAADSASAQTRFNQPPAIPDKYQITIGPPGEFGGSLFWVSPAELMEHYHDIRRQAKHIKRLARNDKQAIVFLTPDPSKAEVQQLRDQDSAYIYSLRNFNQWLANPNTRLVPIGETRAIRQTTVDGGGPARIIERTLYASGETRETLNDGSIFVWWLPVSPP